MLDNPKTTVPTVIDGDFFASSQCFLLDPQGVGSTYEQNSNLKKVNGPGLNIHIPQYLLNGVISGAVSALATNPLVVRSTQIALNVEVNKFNPFSGVQYRLINGVIGTALQRSLDGQFASMIPEGHRESPIVRMGTNAAAAAIQTLVGSPLAYVSMKAQLGSPNIRTTLEEIKGRTFSTIYSGLGVSIAKNVVWCSIYYPVSAEISKLANDSFSIENKSEMVKLGSRVGSGATAGLFTSVFVYPLELTAKSMKLSSSKGDHVSTRQMLAMLYAEKALYRGFSLVGVNMIIGGAASGVGNWAATWLAEAIAKKS
ncbi:MAG: hypothetical protein ACOYK9_05590 [Chlamydiia bacterium]